MKMKKLKYFLVATVLPLMMTSCWAPPEQQGGSDPMSAGLWLYNTAVIQSTYSLDPAAIAFRLNCLLTDKQLQGVDNLIDVKTEAEALEMKFLFGEMVRIEENYKGVAGDYRISFEMNGDKGQSDRNRGGSVIISTGGKLLTELTDDEAWIVEIDPNNMLNYMASISEQITAERVAEYTIARTSSEGGLSKFIVTVQDYQCKSHLGIYTSSWSGSYGITPQTAEPLSMGVARKAAFTMSIYMQGSTFAALDGTNQTSIRYLTTEDNMYKPACSMSNGNVYRSSGEEYVELVGTYDKEAFPSSFVMVKFSGGADCGKVSATMTYNGENRVLQAN